MQSEQIRLLNIAENRRILAEIELQHHYVIPSHESLDNEKPTNILKSGRSRTHTTVNSIKAKVKKESSQVHRRGKQQINVKRGKRRASNQVQPKVEDKVGKSTKKAKQGVKSRTTKRYCTRFHKKQLAEKAKCRTKKNGNAKKIIKRVLKSLQKPKTEKIKKKPLKVPQPPAECGFGHIPGIKVGAAFMSRWQCWLAGIHRYTVRGIHGKGNIGCFSVVLNGNYEDDIDLGECFTYTGEGGMKKNCNGFYNQITSGQHINDQILTKGNLALAISFRKRLPVRVIRGHRLRSTYAPKRGYRYDGLYFVVKYWDSISPAGFRLFKFAFKRCKDQAPPPWEKKNMPMSQAITELPDVKVEPSDIEDPSNAHDKLPIFANDDDDILAHLAAETADLPDFEENSLNKPKSNPTNYRTISVQTDLSLIKFAKRGRRRNFR